MAALIELKVHPRFKQLHRDLTKEEFKLLEELIVDEGAAHDPIVVWRDFILDGHHRYKICTKHDLPFTVDRFADEDFSGEQEAAAWIYRKQMGRRNATEQELSYMRGKLAEITESMQGARRDLTSGQNGQNEDEGQKSKDEIHKEIAEESGVSARTVRRDEARTKLIDQLAETIKQPHLSGETPLTDKQLKILAGKPKHDQATLAREKRISGRSWNDILGLSPPSATKATTRNGSAAAASHDANGAKDTTDAPVEPAPAEFPKKLQPVFDARSRFSGLVSKIGGCIKDARALADCPAGALLEIRQLEAELKNAQQAVKVAAPSAVCPYCKGKKCKECHDLGWMTKERYAGIPKERR